MGTSMHNSSEKDQSADTAQMRLQERIDMHLHEAMRLAAQMNDRIDLKLFSHLIGMAVHAAHEADRDWCGKRLHS